MAETFIGKKCEKCGGTVRRVNSRQCVFATRLNHISAERLSNIRARALINRHENRKKIAEYGAAWRKANRDKVRIKNAAWHKANPEWCRARTANRRALKIRATPSLADLEAIKVIYALCPHEHHVDHIVPLKNPHVCGLHVACNLQYLTATENIRKGNSLVNTQI
jgi:hypothetical protein